jgi:hypothetical protein
MNEFEKIAFGPALAAFGRAALPIIRGLMGSFGAKSAMNVVAKKGAGSALMRYGMPIGFTGMSAYSGMKQSTRMGTPAPNQFMSNPNMQI